MILYPVNQVGVAGAEVVANHFHALGAELLVATRDGLLVCVRTTHQSNL